MRQVPITREQTERLISGTLNGYHGLISLDGLQTQRQAGNGLYEGMTTVTVSNSGRLGSVLEQMAGLTLKTVIPRQEIVVASDVMTGETGDMATSAENLLESYVDQIGRVKHFLDVQEASKIQRVASFKEALSGLDLAYKTGSVKEVSDALERVAETAQWGSKVPVGQVYGAAEEMKKLAMYNLNSGIREAGHVVDNLDLTLQQAKVRSFLFRHAPSADHMYRGPLNHELMARELLRTYGK